MSSTPLVFVWLDKRIGYLPGGNEKLKEKFRKILSPIRQFDKPTSCYDYLNESTKDKNVFFLTTSVFAEEDFLRKISSLTNITQIYIYDQTNQQIKINDKKLMDKIGSQRIIQFDEMLLEQILFDLIQYYQSQGQLFLTQKQSIQAKQLFQLSLQFFDYIDDINQDLQVIQDNLIQQIQQIK